MPELPPIKVKVDVDTSQEDTAAAKTELFAKEIEAKLFPAGEAFVTYGNKGEVASMRISSSMARTRADLDLLTARTKAFAENIGTDFEKGTQAVVKLGESGGASLERLTTSVAQTQNTIPVLTGLLGGLGTALGAAAVALGPITLGIAGAAAALAPFVLQVVAATTILAAFTVGVTAVTFTLGLAFVPLAALTAGVILLAERMFTTGQTLVDPLARFEQMLRNVADNLGRLVMPWALQFTNWMADAVVKLAPLTYQLAYWFGERLPIIMQIANTAFGTVVGAIQQWANVAGNFIDTLTGSGRAVSLLPQLQQMFALILGVGAQAISGLLTNLVALSEWFMIRLPAMAPIVGGIMGNIGGFIQNVGKVAGDLVDWFIKNWPQINATAQWVWDQVRSGWNAFAPVLRTELPVAVGLVTTAFGYLHDHASLIQAILLAVGVAAGICAGAIIGIGAVVIGALAGLQFLYDKFNQLLGIVDAVTGAIGRFLSAVAHTSVAGQAIGAAAGAIGSFLGSEQRGSRDAGPAAVKYGGTYARGGFAVPGSVFTVGEEGPETGYAVPGGGVVITPGAGGPNMGRTERLLSQQNEILAALLRAVSASPPPTFSTRAYGRA